MKTNETMTIDEANQIWNDCYLGDGWSNYTSEQRCIAIDTRQLAFEASNGQQGIWHISDRH